MLVKLKFLAMKGLGEESSLGSDLSAFITVEPDLIATV